MNVAPGLGGPIGRGDGFRGNSNMLIEHLAQVANLRTEGNARIDGFAICLDPIKTILEHLPHGADDVEMNRRVYLFIAKVEKHI